MKHMPVPTGAIMKNAPFPAQKSHLDFVVQAAPKVTLLPKTAAGMPPGDGGLLYARILGKCRSPCTMFLRTPTFNKHPQVHLSQTLSA